MELDNELIFRIQQTQQESKELEEKMEIVDRQISELQGFSVSLNDLDKNKKNKEMLASLGKGVYIKTDIKEDRLFVDVGGGVLVRKSVQEAEKVIEEQMKKLNAIKVEMTFESERINERARGLIEEIEKAERRQEKKG